MHNLDRSMPVMVTGATGYVAGRLVERLLAEGITVHAAVREPTNEKKLAPLKKLAEQLHGKIVFFKADLLVQGSYREAMEGCSVVFHTASPFVTKVSNPQRDLVDPALIGTTNVLETVNQVKSVQRVVLTSSVAAIYGDNIDITRAPNQTLTEEVWNTTSTLDHNPYYYSKRVAEQKAWEIQKTQSRWDLVVINPSLVIGPGIDPFGTSESFNIMRQLGDGTMAMGAPHFSIGVVDVRDVAEAHYQAAIRPNAEGRHIVSAGETTLVKMANMLQPQYGTDYRLPRWTFPKFLVWLTAPAVGITRTFVSRNVGYKFNADNSKSRKKLGINYRPIEVSVVEFFEQLANSGQVKKR